MDDRWRKRSGLTEKDPEVTVNEEVSKELGINDNSVTSLSVLNDSYSASFEQIAKIIEKNL